ncbi:MAG TPA: hypothetical protein PKY50_11050 [Candidatus Competibacter sp.]|nr:hypothetical protein [Candidatus Competibacter sp.]
MTTKPRPTDPAALRQREIIAAKDAARLRERISLKWPETGTSPTRVDSSAEREKRLRDREDALLLNYCEGNAELAAKVRQTIAPEQITAWIASLEIEPG